MTGTSGATDAVIIATVAGLQRVPTPQAPAVPQADTRHRTAIRPVDSADASAGHTFDEYA